MKLIIGILIGGITGVVIWHFVLTRFFGFEPVSRNCAVITIKNESSHKITEGLIDHHQGSVKMIPIPVGKERKYIFSSSGENSYVLTVTLDNDSTLSTKGNYFKSAFRGVETITDSAIISDDGW